MTVAAYIRVSSKSQDHEMQRQAIAKRADSPVFYAEKMSGKTTDRPVLKQLMADVRSGKVKELYVFKLDRLTRSGVADTFQIVNELRRAGVTLFAVADNLCIRPNGDDIVSETLVFALSLAAKLERTAINDRIAAARTHMSSQGRAWGRPRSMTDEQVARARALADEGQTVRAIAADLGVPHATVGRALKSA